MAMKRLGTQNKGDYKKFRFEKIGDILEGYYEGSDTFDFQGKPLTAHKFKDEDGNKVSTIGGTRLNDVVPQIPKGAFTRIEYVKSIRTKSGGTLKEFNVDYEESGL